MSEMGGYCSHRNARTSDLSPPSRQCPRELRLPETHGAADENKDPNTDMPEACCFGLAPESKSSALGCCFGPRPKADGGGPAPAMPVHGDEPSEGERGVVSLRKLRAAFPSASLDDLRRFARARPQDPEAALEMYERHLAWRGAEGQPEVLAKAHARVPPRWVDYGSDGKRVALDGTRVIFARPAKADFKLATAEEHALDLAYVLDQSLAEDQRAYERLPPEGVRVKRSADPDPFQVTVLVDCRPGEGLPNTQAPQMMEFFRLCAKLLQDQYPERLRKMIIYPFPWFLVWLFEAVKRFVDPATAAKIHLISGSDRLGAPAPVAELRQFITKESLPQDAWSMHAGLDSGRALIPRRATTGDIGLAVRAEK